MTLRNVAVPAGDIYPNGIQPTVAPGDVQATVRPGGWLFRHSPGYATIRPGKTEYQDGNRGPGIHFTPQRYAEDVGATVGSTDLHGYPLMVDKDRAVDMVDLAELPGSDRLDDDGTLTPWEAAGNRGVMLSDSGGAPVGGRDIRESERTAPDFGDRTAARPITRNTLRLLHNPTGLLHEDYRNKPFSSVLSAAVVVGVFYLIGSKLEDEYKSRRNGRGSAGPVGAAAAAPVAASGAAVQTVTDAAADATTAIGDAVKTVTDATADVVKPD